MGAENDVVDPLIKRTYGKYALGKNYTDIINDFIELRKKYPDSLEHRFFLAHTYLQAGQSDSCYKLLVNWPEKDTDWQLEKNYILMGSILSRHTPLQENDIEGSHSYSRETKKLQ